MIGEFAAGVWWSSNRYQRSSLERPEVPNLDATSSRISGPAYC